MLSPTDQEKIRTVIKTHWFNYLAFVTALVLYTFVLYFVTGDRTDEAQQIGTLRNIFIFVSIVLGAVKFWIQISLLSNETSYANCQSLDEIIAKYLRYNFIMLALSEVPALFGLVITFLTMRMEEWWLFFIISAILMATSAPRARVLESAADAHAARIGVTE